MSKKQNKRVLITGGSGGIGRAFAHICASKGYDLLLCARSRKELNAAAKEIIASYNVTVDVYATDLSKPGAAQKVWRKATEKNVDIVMNNAGFGDLHTIVGADLEKLTNMIQLNITTVTELSKLAAEHMIEQKSGKILNVASIAAFVPGPGMAVYYATKAYVLSFTEALSEELKNTGVTVTALCPGPTRTNFSAEANASSASIFQGNLPSPEDVAQYGYAQMNKGKVVAVHGLKNRLVTMLVPRLLPRSLVRFVVARSQL